VLRKYITVALGAGGRFRGKRRALSAAIRARTLVSNTANFTSRIFIPRERGASVARLCLPVLEVQAPNLSMEVHPFRSTS